MEWNSSSNSSSDSEMDTKSPFTPTETVSRLSIEKLTNAAIGMRGLYLTPELERSKGLSASRLPSLRPSEMKWRILFPRKHLKWLDKEMHALILFLMFHTDGKSWVTHKHENSGMMLLILFNFILSLPIIEWNKHDAEEDNDEETT